MKATRLDVYRAIDSERSYQDHKWPQPEHKHSFEEFAVYMEDYLSELKHLLSRNDYSDVTKQASDIMRKVTAMGVASLEQNGVNPRAGW